eukprot:853467_1
MSKDTQPSLFSFFPSTSSTSSSAVPPSKESSAGPSNPRHSSSSSKLRKIKKTIRKGNRHKSKFGDEWWNTKSLAEILALFVATYRSRYPCMAQVIALILVLVPNSSYIERMFSQLKNIKTKLRNRLSDELLELLLKIRMAGPSERKFDFGKFCKEYAGKL